MLPSTDTIIIQLNRLPPNYTRFLILLSQLAKKGVMVLVRIIDPDYQEEIVLLLYN